MAASPLPITPSAPVRSYYTRYYTRYTPGQGFSGPCRTVETRKTPGNWGFCTIEYLKSPLLYRLSYASGMPCFPGLSLTPPEVLILVVRPSGRPPPVSRSTWLIVAPQAAAASPLIWLRLRVHRPSFLQFPPDRTS
jgi:hypothetical protein